MITRDYNLWYRQQCRFRFPVQMMGSTPDRHRERVCIRMYCQTCVTALCYLLAAASIPFTGLKGIFTPWTACMATRIPQFGERLGSAPF